MPIHTAQTKSNLFERDVSSLPVEIQNIIEEAHRGIRFRSVTQSPIHHSLTQYACNNSNTLISIVISIIAAYAVKQYFFGKAVHVSQKRAQSK